MSVLGTSNTPVRHSTGVHRTPDAPDAPGTIPASPGETPTEQAAASAPHTGRRPRRRRRRLGASVLVPVLCVLLVSGVAGGVFVKFRMDAQADAWTHTQERVTADYAAQRLDESFLADSRKAAAAARYQALAAGAVTDATAVVTGADAAMAASPHAGDETLAALRAATDAVTATAAAVGKGSSVADLKVVVAAVAAAQQAVVDAEAAWQVAEEARVAEERAAAEEAARAEARARRAPTTTRPGTAPGPATAEDSAAAPPAAPSTTWAPGVASYGIAALGAALNAERAANGLPTLAVTGSASLADHAAVMAAAGTIWHSGHDHIVGWVQPVSDTEMIQAYMRSPGHRAWILKQGKSTVAIGAVTLNGRLYTAMLFS